MDTFDRHVRAWHITSGAGIDGLTLRTHEEPPLGPGEVRVAVHAVSLSFRELLVARGQYVLPVKPDVIAISDGAGEVVAAGPNAERFRPGDRVVATLFPDWLDGPLTPERLPQLGGTLDGMLADSVVLPEQALVPAPSHMSYAEAATLPCAALTAWNALTGDGRGVYSGQTVVMLGSGGVSSWAVQLAKACDARVFVTTGSSGKAARLRELGADEVIDRHGDWPSAVRALTGGRGADRVLDTAGTVPDSLRCLALDGHIALIGAVSGDWPPLDPRALFATAATVRAVAVGSRAQFEVMNAVLEVQGLRPPIARIFPFDQAREAYRYYESENPFGKVVIAVRPDAHATPH
ncbi:zinc-dependent alcohol dehydrogenase family protein [Dactylosporangium sp. CS-033363]|uniref:zinc-dependent alcohol dehydrogenase family protein n=1 Tax=Dactylosporangium sp. CS-033363 TaxID=3239935 RepID=UPI003D92ADD6